MLPQLYISKLRSRRHLTFESLAARYLLTADTVPLVDLSDQPEQCSLQSQPKVSSPIAPEGEGATDPDLLAFALALANSGTTLYGADWATFSTAQRMIFEDGYSALPYVDVTNADHSPNSIAISKGITSVPAWEMPNGELIVGSLTLEEISNLTGVPIPYGSFPWVANMPDSVVELGAPLHVPIDAYDPNGQPLTIEVFSSDPTVIDAQLLFGNRSLRLDVAGYGPLVFQLFEDRAPRPAERVIQLTQSGFYDGVKFHRIIDDFVLQGGDPTGTGTGGSSLGPFDDQFHVDLQHNRSGVLSFAKSTDDTNNSQFFVSEIALPYLDFNHAVFGQLVEGEPIREAISSVLTNGLDRPIFDVLIQHAEVFSDQENGLMMLRAVGDVGENATITVRVTDPDGNTVTSSFQATVGLEISNGTPFLNDIPDVHSDFNSPAIITLSAQDAEGDAPYFSVSKLGTIDYQISIDSSTGEVELVPPPNFSGILQFTAIVTQLSPMTTSSKTDTQLVTVYVHGGWHNGDNPLDVDGDGFIAPSDVLRIINRINATGAHYLPGSSDVVAQVPYVDVNDDLFITPADALQIINFLNSSASGESEGEDEVIPIGNQEGGFVDASQHFSTSYDLSLFDWLWGLDALTEQRRKSR
ncbi:MAG: peptidylprolyl isomerase [Planctomycetales bacterium]|nr:peptidylprolyl isomerase [Planctomycetales bacterium]